MELQYTIWQQCPLVVVVTSCLWVTVLEPHLQLICCQNQPLAFKTMVSVLKAVLRSVTLIFPNFIRIQDIQDFARIKQTYSIVRLQRFNTSYEKINNIVYCLQNEEVMICNCKLVKCKDRHFLQNFKFDFSMIYCLQNPFNKNTFNIYSKFKCNTFIIFAPIFHQLEDIKLFFFFYAHNRFLSFRFVKIRVGER